MTPDFTQWIQATFLQPHGLKQLPSADDQPPLCNGRQACLERLLSVVDGSITPEGEALFRANITHCRPCYQEFDVQYAIKMAIQARAEQKELPQGLLERIRGKMVEMA